MGFTLFFHSLMKVPSTFLWTYVFLFIGEYLDAELLVWAQLRLVFQEIVRFSPNNFAICKTVCDISDGSMSSTLNVVNLLSLVFIYPCEYVWLEL